MCVFTFLYQGEEGIGTRETEIGVGIEKTLVAAAANARASGAAAATATVGATAGVTATVTVTAAVTLAEIETATATAGAGATSKRVIGSLLPIGKMGTTTTATRRNATADAQKQGRKKEETRGCLTEGRVVQAATMMTRRAWAWAAGRKPLRTATRTRRRAGLATCLVTMTTTR
jgi:hypothetical protein